MPYDPADTREIILISTLKVSASVGKENGWENTVRLGNEIILLFCILDDRNFH
jgi:hypothetical protein